MHTHTAGLPRRATPRAAAIEKYTDRRNSDFGVERSTGIRAEKFVDATEAFSRLCSKYFSILLYCISDS